MVRQLLLPLLGLALLTAASATAQTQPANATSPASAAKTARTTPRPAGRTLTARERRAAEAAAKTAAANQAVAMTTPAQQQSNWSGWSNDPMDLPQDGTLYNPRTNLSVAPGIPLNQVSHGVTTDYDGRPLRRAGASKGTTLPTTR